MSQIDKEKEFKLHWLMFLFYVHSVSFYSYLFLSLFHFVVSESGGMPSAGGVDSIYIGLASFFAASTVAFLCLAILIWL